MKHSVYIILLLCVISCVRKEEVADVCETCADTLVIEHPLGFCPDSLSVVEGKVRNGQFFAPLLMKLGLSANEAHNLSGSIGDVFDVRDLRVGNTYKAYYGPDETGEASVMSGEDELLQYLVYDQYRGTQIVFKCQPP